jgi:hypothetical protein
VVTELGEKHKFESRYQSQRTSAVPSAKALYSASVEERATVHCLPDFHEMGVLPRKTM